MSIPAVSEFWKLEKPSSTPCVELSINSRVAGLVIICVELLINSRVAGLFIVSCVELSINFRGAGLVIICVELLINSRVAGLMIVSCVELLLLINSRVAGLVIIFSFVAKPSAYASGALLVDPEPDACCFFFERARRF